MQDMRAYLLAKCEEDREEDEYKQNIIYGIIAVILAIILCGMVSMSIIFG